MIVHCFKIGFVLALCGVTMSSAEDQELSRRGCGDKAGGGSYSECEDPKGQSCQEIYDEGERIPAVYCIHPHWSSKPFQVFCRMYPGGGWTIIQRRKDGSENFYQDWDKYRDGFGSPDKETWLGLEKIFQMTDMERMKLRIDFIDVIGRAYYVEYDDFKIGEEKYGYKLLSVGDDEGNSEFLPNFASLGSQLNCKFSTDDQDNDDWDTYDCAEQHQAGWWLCWGAGMTGSGSYCQEDCTMSHVTTGQCVRCTLTNLNGVYDSSSPGNGLFWVGLPESSDCGITFTEMAILPVRD